MRMSWAISSPNETTESSIKISDWMKMSIVLLGTLVISIISVHNIYPKRTVDLIVGELRPSITYPMVAPLQKSNDQTEDEVLLSTVKEAVPVPVEGESLVEIKLGPQHKPIHRVIRVKRQNQPVLLSKSVSNKVQEEPLSPIKIETDVLSRIRTDKKRIYIQDEYKNDHIHWGIRNVSPNYGVEVWVENIGDSDETFYLPQVIVEGSNAILDGQVLSPGSKIYGYVEVKDISKLSKVTIKLKLAGQKELTQKVKLSW